eukprot:TRINITY_DN24702_c0_g1_i1.p1 TRINITY_DN24702_c0_g1~~TRINITY_DN24702_c0_g1_i1.p1  ORF type:complete len:284 (+),score=85.22 TRINITY_DN24702_c0_g1_i1:55-906(+)
MPTAGSTSADGDAASTNAPPDHGTAGGPRIEGTELPAAGPELEVTAGVPQPEADAGAAQPEAGEAGADAGAGDDDAPALPPAAAAAPQEPGPARSPGGAVTGVPVVAPAEPPVLGIPLSSSAGRCIVVGQLPGVRQQLGVVRRLDTAAMLLLFKTARVVQYAAVADACMTLMLLLGGLLWIPVFVLGPATGCFAASRYRGDLLLAYLLYIPCIIAVRVYLLVSVSFPMAAAAHAFSIIYHLFTARIVYKLRVRLSATGSTELLQLQQGWMPITPPVPPDRWAP